MSKKQTTGNKSTADYDRAAVQGALRAITEALWRMNSAAFTIAKNGDDGALVRMLQAGANESFSVAIDAVSGLEKMLGVEVATGGDEGLILQSYEGVRRDDIYELGPTRFS